MSEISERLKKMAELNFCDSCYQKYKFLIHGEIEHLLSEPISDWRQVESNINHFMMKAIGYVNKRTDSTAISLDTDAFTRKMAKEHWTLKRKLKFLQKHDVIGESLYCYLNKVRNIRNKIHPPNTFSKRDYSLFKYAKHLTDAMYMPILFDLPGNRDSIERYAQQLLSAISS